MPITKEGEPSMKKADKSGAAYAFIIGEDELAVDQVTIKPLREECELEDQKQVVFEQVVDTIRRELY